MAVPPEITIQALSGSYTLNRALSDSSQQVLKMQSVGFLVRQAVAYSNITITLHQYKHATTGLPHLDQYQTSTGGIKNFEDRIMDWEWTVKENWIWGKVKGRSRYVKLVEIEDSWLREGWEDAKGEIVEGWVEGVKDGWSAWQVWGFAEVDGQRSHVRKILGKREGWKEQRIRMIYDWKGPATEADMPKQA